MKKPVSKFAFRIQPAALQRGGRRGQRRRRRERRPGQRRAAAAQRRGLPHRHALGGGLYKL
jgi:hypothetical protein